MQASGRVCLSEGVQADNRWVYSCTLQRIRPHRMSETLPKYPLQGTSLEAAMSAKRKGKRPTSRLVLEGSREPLARQRADAPGVKKLEASNGRMEETLVERKEELSLLKTAESLMRETGMDAGVKTEQDPPNDSVVKTEEADAGDMEEHALVRRRRSPPAVMEEEPHVNPQASPVRGQEGDSTVKTEKASLAAMEDPLDETRKAAKLESSLEEPTSEGPARLKATIQGVTFSKMGADDDPEAFLSTFESAATRALWPKEQWAMRVAPFLSEEAYAIYQSLPFYTAEDYDQLKEALLDHTSMIEETYRKKFRSVAFTAGSKPSMVAHRLQDLGRRWLKPEIRSPDDILERIIIEQFIKILPVQAGEWLTQQHVRTLDRAVQLVEGYLAGEAVGRASKAGSSNAWMPPWTQEPHAEDAGLINNYQEQIREHWAGILEPQEALFLKTKGKPLLDAEKEVGIRRWNRCHWRQRDHAQHKMGPSMEYENGVSNSAGSSNQNMSPTEGKEFPCTECGKNFSHAKYLHSHQHIHRGDKPYRCDECGKSFRESRKLITHQRVHTGERPFKCGDCGKGFSQVAHLSSHKRMHTGEKPYTCNECGNHFGHLSTLISHVLIHTGEKPYKCSVCEKGFRRLTDKRRHERTHTGEKPYKCSECGKSFNQSGSLYTHHRIHSIERITI